MWTHATRHSTERDVHPQTWRTPLHVPYFHDTLPSVPVHRTPSPPCLKAVLRHQCEQPAQAHRRTGASQIPPPPLSAVPPPVCHRRLVLRHRGSLVAKTHCLRPRDPWHCERLTRELSPGSSDLGASPGAVGASAGSFDGGLGEASRSRAHSRSPSRAHSRSRSRAATACGPLQQPTYGQRRRPYERGA